MNRPLIIVLLLLPAFLHAQSALKTFQRSLAFSSRQQKNMLFFADSTESPPDSMQSAKALQKDKSYLIVSGFPEQAQVFMNRDKMLPGDTPRSIRTGRWVLGKIPVHRTELPAGVYNVAVSKSGYESQSFKLWLKPAETTKLTVTLKPKSRTKALAYSLLYPGAGQFYSERNPAAIAFMVLETCALAGIALSTKELESKLIEFDDARYRYRANIDLQLMDDYYAEVESKYAQAKDVERIRDNFIIAAVSVYVLNLMDVYLFWPFKHLKVQPSVHSTGSIFDGSPKAPRWAVRLSFAM